ncbi:OmpA family protein [Foetidibacter luteolus]|uniref:OmpA family protein n=1 Tax=Foetidibacter luteolus TaxID=2608880 RepID=UPI00129BF189|nr:OmpA family protein [Foetidibacter luteolus]
MKKVLLSLLTFTIVCSYAQETISYKKRPSLAIHLVFNDFKTADLARKNGLGSVINNKNWSRIKDMDIGFGLEYLQGLTEHLDFSARLDATSLDYLFNNMPGLGNDNMLLEGDANIKLKLLSDKYFLTPYLSAGAGVSRYTAYWAAYMPLGGGLQVSLGKGDAFLFSNFQYRIPVTENANYHFNYSFGFGAPLVGRKEPKVIPPPPPPMPEKDTDEDGIPDSQDKCVDVKGIAEYQGCPIPDTDSDGINDEEDKCPTVAGLAKYQGCPIPDTDKDGVNDEEDKCPTVAGVARYQGCPIPDTDKDGVNDEEDKCPNEAGPASNQGCPEKAKVMQAQVDMAAKQVYFATGSSTLLKKSNAALSAIVKLLQENSDLALDIEGHTDNVGKPKSNMTLSQRRANAVMKFFTSRKIEASRLTATGYGDTVPVADNKTAAGRAQNRRVEMKLKQL